MPIRKIVVATNKKSKTAKTPVPTKSTKPKMPVVKKPGSPVKKAVKATTPSAARKHPHQGHKPIVRVADQVEGNEVFQDVSAQTHPEVVRPVVDEGGAVIMTPVEHIETK